MTISIWRYSHLTLAVLSFLLLTLASVTGVILAFKPVQEKTQPYRAANFRSLTLAETLPVLRKTYPELSALMVDDNQFVRIKGSDADGKKIDAYVDPRTGKVLGKPKPESDFFQWVTAFHRSLFIHETGRALIGIASFLLLLITISGAMLIIQRQRGIKRFFTRIAFDNFAQFYHVVLGRWSLIPIFIIAGSGTYLSLERFGLIGEPIPTTKVDFDSIRSNPIKKLNEFEVFKQTKLADVVSIEYPFSEDVEDYFILKLKTRELAVNQLTGDVLSEVVYPTTTRLTNLSLDLHTGRASIIWAIILAFASANILFFIYSGFAITWKRISGRTRNKFKAEEAKVVILVGSENGNTYNFAQAVHKALLKQGEKSFVTELNKYQLFPNAAHILVLTATYGLGDAPTNATKFGALLAKFPQKQQVRFSVVGFGSHAYPDFCKYAFEVHQLLSHQLWAQPLTDVHTINDRSPQEFGLWAEAWSQNSGIPLSALSELQTAKAPKEEFTVVNITKTEDHEGTFVINLKPKKRTKITSGDLLAIYPANDHRERLYSIGIVDQLLRLSVRLQPNGLGSGYLHDLKPGEKINARIVHNSHFYFPSKANEVIMIANGTGIAPFLGMIAQNSGKKSIHLYGGFRNRLSYNLHQELLTQHQADGNLTNLQVAFSREGNKQYVSQLVKQDAAVIGDVLDHGGAIMICGSLLMQKDVMELLEEICQQHKGKSLSYYQSRGQLLTDCY